jgi:hypothetical protein
LVGAQFREFITTISIKTETFLSTCMGVTMNMVNQLPELDIPLLQTILYFHPSLRPSAKAMWYATIHTVSVQLLTLFRHILPSWDASRLCNLVHPTCSEQPAIVLQLPTSTELCPS